jgi:hypothetical protein
MDSTAVLVHVEGDDEDDGSDSGEELWAGEAHPSDNKIHAHPSDGHHETNAFIQPHKFDTPRTQDELDARIRKQSRFCLAIATSIRTSSCSGSFVEITQKVYQ